MKKIITLLMLLMLSLCFAEQLQIDKNTTIADLSVATEIPIKKLANIMKMDLNQHDLLSELGISQEDTIAAVKEYEKVKVDFFWNIVLIGMVIVFASLIVTGFLIGLLKHINIIEELKEKKALDKANSGKTKIKKITTTNGNLSNDSIVAVITAIYLHELEVDEKNKMNLTWKRTPLSMWRASNAVNLPNRNFHKVRRTN